MNYTDEDKVSIKQLNPKLQELLADLISSQAFQELKSSLDIHKNDNSRHLTEDVISKINYSYNRIKETIDEDVGEMLKNFVNTVVSMQEHIDNDIIHWTAIEKSEYKNLLNLVRNAIAKMESNISQYQLDTSSNYVSHNQYNDLDTNVQQHIANSYVHIFPHERTNWNNMLLEAKSYSDNILQAHKQDSISHTNDVEKAIWNDHVNNSAIHMNITDLGLIHNHLEDLTIHTTLEDKAKIRQLQDQVTSLTETVNQLQSIVNAQQAAIDKIKVSISILE